VDTARGLVYRGLMCRRVWRWAPLSIGAQLEHMGGGVLFAGNSERQLKLGTVNGAVLSMGALSCEPGGEILS